eukprot:1435962-Amphidinium_carterae.1
MYPVRSSSDKSLVDVPMEHQRLSTNDGNLQQAKRAVLKSSMNVLDCNLVTSTHNLLLSTDHATRNSHNVSNTVPERPRRLYISRKSDAEGNALDSSPSNTRASQATT